MKDQFIISKLYNSDENHEYKYIWLVILLKY